MKSIAKVEEMKGLEETRKEPRKELSVIKRNTAPKELSNMGKNVGETKEYELIEITSDSGAAESVVPSAFLPQFPTRETDQSLNGEEFVAANGSIIENEGEKRCTVFTQDGVKRAMTFQVTGVHKALASVSRIVDGGARVVYDSEDCGGSYIEYKNSKETIPLKRKHGVWVLEVWVEKKPTGF